MQRFATQKLLEWKVSTNRKPLIIEGARQVGKTWLMQEFGKNHYNNSIYINFDRNSKIHSRFDIDLDPKRIIRDLSIHFETDITSETLIIFDEIQECKNALRSLKYFCEETPEYHIVAAGSLLGVALHEGDSFPVGKVDFLKMYPLSFYEFLSAIGKNKLLELLQSKDIESITSFKEELTELLRTYYFVGGMPASINSYISNGNFVDVREVQNTILNAYKLDFSKHIPLSSYNRVDQIWDSIPRQLSKENKKFVYNVVDPKAKSKEYSIALNWLIKTGLTYSITKISRPSIPIRAYEEDNFFKLYTLDVGLLGAMSDLSAKAVIDGDRVFTEFKGALTEQYVLQQMKSMGIKSIHYWTSSATAEIDFVINLDDFVVPIEVKASTNKQAKSLKIYKEKYSPKKSFRISLNDYKASGDLHNIPLYAVESLLT